MRLISIFISMLSVEKKYYSSLDELLRCQEGKTEITWDVDEPTGKGGSWLCALTRFRYFRTISHWVNYSNIRGKALETRDKSKVRSLRKSTLKTYLILIVQLYTGTQDFEAHKTEGSTAIVFYEMQCLGRDERVIVFAMQLVNIWCVSDYGYLMPFHYTENSRVVLVVRGVVIRLSTISCCALRFIWNWSFLRSVNNCFCDFLLPWSSSTFGFTNFV